jgi:hypothetical protein
MILPYPLSLSARRRPADSDLSTLLDASRPSVVFGGLESLLDDGVVQWLEPHHSRAGHRGRRDRAARRCSGGG